MDETKRELVKAWLIKADHDFATARKMSTEPDAYFDTAIYHCQQAAEKAIGDALYPTPEQFDEALSAADSVWEFVLSVLPVEVHP